MTQNFVALLRVPFTVWYLLELSQRIKNILVHLACLFLGTELLEPSTQRLQYLPTNAGFHDRVNVRQSKTIRTSALNDQQS